MYDFRYVKAGSVSDAVAALANTGAEDAQPLSGGQTLLPTLRARLGQPSTLVDLTGIGEMAGIEVSGETIRIGAATTHGAVASNPDVQARIPGLAWLASRIGCPAVRHRGTMGGSIANHDPAACWPAACLGLGATIHTSDGDIAADDFFTGMFDTSLGAGQIVTGATFPIPHASDYQKFAQPASRFPLVGVFVSKGGTGSGTAVRVAVTGASESGAHRWGAAEDALAGSFTPEAVPAPPDPDGLIGDLHGSPEYRAHLVAVMTRRAVKACA